VPINPKKKEVKKKPLPEVKPPKKK